MGVFSRMGSWLLPPVVVAMVEPSPVDALADLYRLIKRFEGCRLMPYWCPAGVLTCGWGSTGVDVILGQPWTQQKADYRMQLDARRFARDVVTLCPALDDRQRCAIADFAYNLGAGNLRASTLRRKINAGQLDAVPAQLRRWVYAGGKKLNGLVLRREAEIALFMTRRGAQ